jgi:hypothetical protein
VILRAANKIDYLLANKPYHPDAILLGDENTLIVEPLAVDFTVLEAERRVLVINVWMIGYLNDDAA